MKKLLLSAAALAFLGATAAHASVIPVLESVTPVGPDFEFSYDGTLAGDQGLVFGSELVIFDFVGYVPGSATPGAYGPDLIAFTELTSSIPPPLGETDDPTIPNLVFEWVGAPFHATGGPFAPFPFVGLTAQSTSGNVAIGDYSARTIINTGAARGLAGFNDGFVGVPGLTVPEPASWALLILGFGGVGALMRARPRLRSA